jgi:uncharacterized 2Fe-2S/4Fe-4S cluster protein (DUF4445 family)
MTDGLCTLILMPSGRRGQVVRGTSVLDAARTLGVEIESICGGRQTCGKCQILVEDGTFLKHQIVSADDHVSPIESREAAYRETHPLNDRRLACAVRVLDDVLISVPDESQARKQVIAKAATDRVIDVQPAIRQVYVEVAPAELEDRGGDWERLRDALGAQWGLANLTIDPMILPTLQPALKEGRHAVTVAIWQDSEVLRIRPGYFEGIYGLAVDVGSTSIAAHLCDLRTGAVVATETMVNPQVRYGEDLMSRVSYGMLDPRGAARLHRSVIGALNQLARRAASATGIDLADVLDLVVVGNPVMHHLLLGIDPVELGGAPFALAISSPLDLKARDLGIRLGPGSRVHVLPCIAGHVGADNVAVQLAEAPADRDEVTLVVDVGTNAEIVLGNRAGVFCASSPTGPAFEGAQIRHGQRAAPGAIERVRIDPITLEPRFKVIGYDEWIEEGAAIPAHARPTGICGSGIIEVIAELYLAGLLGADGRFAEDATSRTSRVRLNGRTAEYILADASVTATGAPIVVVQGDVRAIQLAKAALYAGVKLLLAAANVARVERVLLAGAFGSYLSPLHAMVLGMIPDCPLESVTAVGNAAGDGARIALLNREQRRRAREIAETAEHVQIAVAPEFQTEFVAAMAIPHATDLFPHLDGMLPNRSPAPVGRRRRERRIANNEYASRS